MDRPLRSCRTPPSPTPRRPRRPGRRAGVLGARLAALALAGVLAAGGVVEVQGRRAEAAAAQAAADTRRAEAAERALRVRVASADTARLTAAAVGYAAMRRTEALSAAHAALQAAHAVVVNAGAPDVPVGTAAPLDQAAAQLVALMDVTPAPPSVVVAEAAPTTGLDPAGAPAAAPTADAAVAPATSGPPAPAADGPADAAAASTRPPAASPERTAEALRALDLGATAEVLAAARTVAELSVQVQAATDAAVAAAAAARAVAEEAEKVERAERAEQAALAERIAATDAAPNGHIPRELLCGVALAPDVLLRCDAARALDRLLAAYRAEHGRDLVVVSGYRSFDEQVAVKASRGDLAAEPGRSNHGRALAVDFGGFGAVGVFTAPGYLWMKQHAGEFGWHHLPAMEPGGSGPQEPWHWEFDTRGRLATPAGPAAPTTFVAQRPQSP